MSSLIEHCNATRSLFGDDYAHVHKWLDELFKLYGPKHRKFRHHKQGIEEVRKKWGNIAANVAELHISMDLYNCPIPDETDYIGGDGCWPVGPEWNC